MTYARKRGKLSAEEWNEMIALKNAIDDLPGAVHPDKLEMFTEYFVRSLKEKGG